MPARRILIVLILHECINTMQCLGQMGFSDKAKWGEMASPIKQNEGKMGLSDKFLFIITLIQIQPLPSLGRTYAFSFINLI